MSESSEASLVAFFDILGTKDMVRRGAFSDFHSLDFANPAGLMALRNPNIRFAAFSDSVVVSCGPERVTDFLSVLNYIFGQWFADFIFVRGGLAFGELTWVDDPSIDLHFHAAPNFALARLYGKALNEAIELQEKSGPGMVCFVNDAASRILEKVNRDVILSGPTNILVWATASELNHLCKAFSRLAKDGSLPPELQRHVRATRHYMVWSKMSRKAMPSELSFIEPLKAKSRIEDNVE